MTIDRACGPEGCELDWLVSTRLEVDADPVSFTRFVPQRMVARGPQCQPSLPHQLMGEPRLRPAISPAQGP